MRCTGPLTLTGIVNCPVDCGSHGRCVALSNATATPAARSSSSSSSGFACECECGWAADPATGRCEAPGDTCPLFPSGFLLPNGSVSAGSSAASASRLFVAGGGGRAGGDACPDSGAVAATGGSCPATYGFDYVSKTCTRCQPGWGGAGCRQCVTDDACRVSGGSCVWLCLCVCVCVCGCLGACAHVRKCVSACVRARVRVCMRARARMRAPWLLSHACALPSNPDTPPQTVLMVCLHCRQS
jgi:hypothetical protein